MPKLPLRGLVVALATVGAIYSCSNNGSSPTQPQSYRQGSRTAQSECGVTNYLESLNPVLLSWQDSIQTWQNNSNLLDTPPDPANAHSVVEHVSTLVPVLQQWRGAINGALASSLLDSLPDFNPDSLSAEDYTEKHLAPTLVGWESALEGKKGSAFLSDLPVITHETTPPDINCPPDTTIGCAQDSLQYEFPVSAVDNCDESPTVTAVPPSGSFFHVGPTLVTITAKDRDGNTSICTFTVTVTQGGEASVDSIRAVPSVLWPPNHKLVNVCIKVDLNSDCPSNDVHCRITEVTSNEPPCHQEDWIITGDLTLKLRAERSGNGNGRVYSIHVVCDDQSGTLADRWVTVKVPHDQGDGDDEDGDGDHGDGDHGDGDHGGHHGGDDDDQGGHGHHGHH